MSVAEGILEKASSLHITMKTSCSDIMHAGLTSDESVSTCLLSEDDRIDSMPIMSFPAGFASLLTLYAIFFFLLIAPPDDMM